MGRTYRGVARVRVEGALEALQTRPEALEAIQALEASLVARVQALEAETASSDFVRKLGLMLLPGENPKHVQYACMSWAAHLRQACTPEEHQGQDSECFCRNLVDLLQRLVLDSDNLKRLDIINLMGETGCTLKADLDYARSWLPSDVCIPFPTPFLRH